MDAQAHLAALAELTSINANGMSPEEKRQYEDACDVIAGNLEGLPASEMAAKTRSAINDVIQKYNAGKAAYERNKLPVPSFDDAVSLGHAMWMYDRCKAEENT